MAGIVDCFTKSYRSWRAARFIMGLVLSKHLIYYAIIANLIDHLMEDWKEQPINAASTINLLVGTAAVAAFIAAFLADTILHRFRTVLISTAAYVAGLALLTVSASLHFSKNPKAHSSPGGLKSVLYIALFLVSIGMGGLQATLKAFGADQFQAPNNQKFGGKLGQVYLSVWWYTSSVVGTVAGIAILVVTPTLLRRDVDYAICTGIMFVAAVPLIYGWKSYDSTQPHSSPFKLVSQVLANAVRNRHLPLDPGKLSHGPEDGDRPYPRTNSLRWLEKAALQEPSGNPTTRRHCTVQEVEEIKSFFRTLPIWATFIIFGMVMSMKISYFLLQALSMDRKLFGNLKFPITSLIVITALSSSFISALLNLAQLFKNCTGSKYELSPTKKIGIGFSFSILCCIVAALVEMKRLKVATMKNAEKLSFFLLVPQYFLLGVMDEFAHSGLKGLFYDQFPDATKSFNPSYYESLVGLGSFLTSLLVVITNTIIESYRGKGHGWLSNTVDQSHLDNFYWTLAVLSFINLCLYVYLSWTCYIPKRIEKKSIRDCAWIKGASLCWK